MPWARAEWRINGEDFMLFSPVTRPRGGRIGPSGVQSGVILRKRWTWDQIAVVTWDSARGAFIAVCLYGDPYPKSLSPGARHWRDIRTLLEPVRPLVESRGARVETEMTPPRLGGIWSLRRSRSKATRNTPTVSNRPPRAGLVPVCRFAA